MQAVDFTSRNAFVSYILVCGCALKGQYKSLHVKLVQQSMCGSHMWFHSDGMRLRKDFKDLIFPLKYTVAQV